MNAAAALGMSGLIFVSAHGAAVSDQSEMPEEDYSFLSIRDGPCVPKIGVRIEPKQDAECKRMTEPRRYRGRWYVAFETSLFTPIGQQSCIETKGQTECAELGGKALPWPGRWDCAREYQVEFIGRRNALPGHNGIDYKIIVERLISAKRMPDPYDENCDPELHPQVKTKA